MANFRVLFACVWCLLLGRSLILPVVTYYTDQIHRDATREGHSHRLDDDRVSTDEGASSDLAAEDHALLAALFYVAYAIGALSFGCISDRVGRRPVILVCCVCASVGFLWQALSYSYIDFLIARTFSGAWAALPGVAQTYIADLATPKQIPSLTARLGSIYGVMWGGGPLISIAFSAATEYAFGLQDIDHPYRSWLFRSCLIAAGLLNMVMAIYAYFKLEESLASKRKSDPEGRDEGPDIALTLDSPEPVQHAGLRGRVPPRVVFWLLSCAECTSVLVDIGFAIFTTICTLMFQNAYHWDREVVGAGMLLWGSSYALINIMLYDRVERYFGPLGTCGFGGFMMATGIGYTLLAKHVVGSDCAQLTVENQWLQFLVFSPLCVMHGIGYGLSISSTPSAISQLAPARQLATWLSVWAAACCVGCFCVVPLGMMVPGPDQLDAHRMATHTAPPNGCDRRARIRWPLDAAEGVWMPYYHASDYDGPLYVGGALMLALAGIHFALQRVLTHYTISKAATPMAWNSP